MWAKKQKNHDGLSDSKMSSFRVKFSLLIAEFSGDLCKQDCSLNGIAFIQIAPTFLMLSEFTPCPNPPQSTICGLASLGKSIFFSLYTIYQSCHEPVDHAADAACSVSR